MPSETATTSDIKTYIVSESNTEKRPVELIEEDQKQTLNLVKIGTDRKILHRNEKKNCYQTEIQANHVYSGSFAFGAKSPRSIHETLSEQQSQPFRHSSVSPQSESKQETTSFGGGF